MNSVRRVRIAVSVLFGLLTVALCVLWVRSYWRCDILFRCDVLATVGNTSTSAPVPIGATKRIVIRQSGMRTVTLGQNNGYCYFIRLTGPVQGFGGLALHSAHGWKLSSEQSSDNPARFQWIANAQRIRVKVPYWFLVAITASLAASCVLQTRFSLRAMLIATTLIAVVLGLEVWLVR